MNPADNGTISALGMDYASLVLEVSRAFLVRPPEDTDAIIEEALGRLAALIGAERGWVLQVEGEAETLSARITHHWQAAGLSPLDDEARTFPIESMPWYRNRKSVGEITAIPDVNELPAAAAAECGLIAGMELRSLIGAPLVREDAAIGCLAFGSSRPGSVIADRVAPLLPLLADLFATALARRRDAETLRLSEERAEVAVRGTGVGLWDWYVQSGKTIFDERWAEIIGYKLHELEPVSIDTWIRFVHPDDLPLSNEKLQAHFRGETAIYECEARMQHKNGDWIWVLDRGKVFEWDDEGQPVRMAGTHLDITERKHSEQEHERLRLELLQVQKMESVGRLAGGVAHDFNNLLTVISGYAEMMQFDADLPAEQRGNVRLILDAAGRAQELTQQLLAFSRKQVIRPRPVDLNRQIERSLKMYRRLLGEDISLAFRPAADLPPIKADAQQLDQVLGNLLVNARDALYAAGARRTGRAITVDTKRLGISPEDASFYGLPAGPYVLLTVCDNGVGMDAATRSQIFDPFFTTKRRDKGTGLGLATVLGIVQQNDGAIKVYSEPEKGTTFRVLWPAAVGEVADQADEPAPDKALPGTETLLVVEDEPSIREFTARAMSRLGYKVVVAGDGEEALSLLGGDLAPDLLLTDVVMPGLNGAQVAERARAIMPDLPVLFMSGYTDEIIAQHGILEPGVDLIEKPYTVADLSRRIRGILDKA
jgi:two-component system cell cycle sensor histidine kinase/response regulator CckA